MTNKLNKEKCLELLSAFKTIQGLDCTPEEYRVKEKAKCFHCTECWIACLENMLKDFD